MLAWRWFAESRRGTLDLLAEVEGENAGRRRAQRVELHDLLQVLAARALGWMGQAGGGSKASRQPPWRRSARVGARRVARRLGAERRSTAGPRGHGFRTPTASLWRARLGGRIGGRVKRGGVWLALEPYRAARLVCDLERVEPGLTPHHLAPASGRRSAPGRRQRVGGHARRPSGGSVGLRCGTICRTPGGSSERPASV